MRWKPKPEPEWQRHFAWLPIYVCGTWVWWEWTERRFLRGGFCDGIWEYRLLPQSP